MSATPAEILDVLRRARARIADPAHWCQRTMAAGRLGQVVWPTNDEAVAWCAAGALEAEAHGLYVDGGPERHPAAFRAWELLVKAAVPHSIVGVNDREGHGAVLALYDRAISDAERAGLV